MTSAEWKQEMRRTIAAISDAQYALLQANTELTGKRFGVAGYGDRVALIDAAALELAAGKWLYNRSTGECADYARRTSSIEDLRAARDRLRTAVELADASRTGSRAPAVAPCTNAGTEISYYGEVPIVPSICPVVILRGDSRTMGAQYVRQCVDIFGTFVFEHAAARDISGEKVEILRSWERAMCEHTPEILDMCAGMADGAREVGIPLSYEHAVAMWTDLRPPAPEPAPIGVLDAEGGEELGGYFGLVRIPTGETGTCSGAAAWGGATRDGRACFASSTDHDCTFQVTIVAYPDDGYPFVYTPFSVNGSIPGLGRFGFSGHPGFNGRGVTYVHHGGYESCAEPRELWGYGVTRGAATMHILRYASSAREAMRMELDFPVGDAGRILGSAGGFYVDDEYGYVLEDRTPGRPVYRESTSDPHGAPHEFLYATNNLLSPDLGHGFCPPPDGYRYGTDTGWFTPDPQRVGEASPGAVTRQLCAASSFSRNAYLYRELLGQSGSISAESLLTLFRAGPRFAASDWAAGGGGRRGLSGDLAEASVGGRHNAFIAFGSPATGQYSGAVGLMAPRDSFANGTAHGYCYVDETGVPWELRLGESCESLVADARATAEHDIESADRLLRRRAGAAADEPSLRRLLGMARAELDAGAGGPGRSDDVDALARACRAFTRAQVRARQVVDALGGGPDES